jgi:putative two-component system response regulator
MTAKPDDTLPRLLVVDDTPENLALLRGLLKGHYHLLFANSGEQALRMVSGHTGIDMILLDVMMPGMDGMEVCRRIKDDAATRDIPVVFLSASDGKDEQAQGLALGGADYVSKPIHPALLLSRLKNQWLARKARTVLEAENQALTLQLGAQNKTVQALQDATLQALLTLLATREGQDDTHQARLQAYVAILCDELTQSAPPEYAISEADRALICRSAPLHDLGNVGTPDDILLKSGPLDDIERQRMKQHTLQGYAIIRSAEQKMGAFDSFLRFAGEIALSHHEKWDGSGYPHGLQGSSIPLSARIVAMADAYDAMTSARHFRQAFAHAAAVDMIQACAGTHFDPVIIDAFSRSAARLAAVPH